MKNLIEFRPNDPNFFLRRYGYLFSHTVLDFLYPPRCLICEAPADEPPWLCDDCGNQLIQNVGIQIHRHSSDFHYLSDPMFFDQVLTVWPYLPEIETLIHHVKYRSGRKAGLWLGRFVAERLDPFLSDESDSILIPVPLHPVRKRERGYNQSTLYTKGLSERLGIPIDEKVLIRTKATSSQTFLSAEERQENVRDVFSVKNPKEILGKRIYLMDDLVTTGATLNACARALKECGAAEVVGVALVRPRLDQTVKAIEESEKTFSKEI